MSFEPVVVGSAVGMGVGASLVMDLWNLFLKSTFNIQSLNYCLLGRWICHVPRGTIRHANIGTAVRRPFECTVGWMAHYAIGVAFAFMFLLVAPTEWLARPTVQPAMLFGIATVVFPFFVLQPSLGLGIAASRTPSPTKARLKSLVTHTVFGLGLYVCAVGVSYIARVLAPGVR